MNRSLCMPAVWLGVLFLVAACGMPGQKLLELRARHNGNDLLVTSFDVLDSSSKVEIWGAVSERPCHARFVAPALTRMAGERTEVTLRGAVEVTITHGSRQESAATVRDLTFVRTSATSEDWRPAAKEIDRLQRAAGL